MIRCFGVMLASLSMVILSGCASTTLVPEDYLSIQSVPSPSAETLHHCHGYGCRFVSEVKISKQDWRAIKKSMGRTTKTPELERKKLSKVIGMFEQRIGKTAGTDGDIHGTFKKTGNYQHDCVDESVNTTTYLMVLRDAGLIKHHSVLVPTSRFPLFSAGGWPHQTAVIQDNETGTRYAVDSWFYDNGHDAVILPVPVWKKTRIKPPSKETSE